MAYIVLNSKFKPFSYSEMVQPVMMATEAHQQAENNYGDLTLEANKMEALINSQSDSKSYGMYKKYADDLKAQAEELSSKGLTLNSRKNLNNIRARYGSEIEPIKAASNEYAKMIETRQQLSSRGSGVVFKNKYSSVDDFLGGRKADNEYLSEKDIIATAGAEFQAYSQTLLKDPEFTKILGGQKYQMLQKSGYSPEAIAQVLMGDPAAQPKLKEMYEAKWKSLGADAYAPEDQEKIKGALSTAMYAGLQKPVVNYMNNEEYTNAVQRAQMSAYYSDVKKEKILTGQEPYRIDDDGKKYYHDSTFMWEVVNGKMENQMPLPTKSSTKDNDTKAGDYTAQQERERNMFTSINATFDKDGNPVKAKKQVVLNFDDPETIASLNDNNLVDFNELKYIPKQAIAAGLVEKYMGVDEVNIYGLKASNGNITYVAWAKNKDKRGRPIVISQPSHASGKPSTPTPAKKVVTPKQSEEDSDNEPMR